MSACVSPPQPSVSHIVATAPSMAQAASTALPPFWKIIGAGGGAERLAGDGDPVPAVEHRLGGTLGVDYGGQRECGGDEDEQAGGPHEKLSARAHDDPPGQCRWRRDRAFARGRLSRSGARGPIGGGPAD